MKRECGTCTQCCKTMGVSDLASPKPPGKWCRFCKVGTGCGVYPDRPQSCREFECVWLQEGEDIFPDALRPDRCKVVLQSTLDGHGIVAHCDPDNPMAWRRHEVLRILKVVSRAGAHASARAGNRYWVVTSKTEWEVPEQYIVRGPNNKVDVRIPAHIAVEIGART